MGEPDIELTALENVLVRMGEVAVAVSGGVDSLTLAAFAHRQLGERCTMFHAVSPAVPSEGTQRTHALAEREGWTLRVIDAGEFDNGDYMRNPVNRCFYCKTSFMVRSARIPRLRSFPAPIWTIWASTAPG